MKDVIIKCGKGEVKKTLASIEKKDRNVRWATKDKPTGWGEFFDTRGVYLVIERNTLTFIETDEFEDTDKKGKTVVSADEFLGNSKKPSIVIFRRGREVIAKDVATGNKGIAKCSPDDEFVFKTGASIALARLMAKTPDALNHDVKDEWIKALGLTPVKKRVFTDADRDFKVGDYVTLKKGIASGKRYGGLTLYSGRMYEYANGKRLEVETATPNESDGMYHYRCKGADGNYFYYTEPMLDKWDESKICEGDKVRIKKGCTGMRYDSYYEWVKEHITDPELLLAFEREDHVDTSLDYDVVKIAPHKLFSQKPVAYIKHKDDYRTLCYLFDIEALEKA